MPEDTERGRKGFPGGRPGEEAKIKNVSRKDGMHTIYQIQTTRNALTSLNLRFQHENIVDKFVLDGHTDLKDLKETAAQSLSTLSNNKQKATVIIL